MSSSLTSGVPLGMPRSAASRPPSRPLSDLALLGGSPQWEGHHGLDPSIWRGPLLSSPWTMQSGGGARPLPHSNWYHPSPAPALAGVPGPPLPCSPPTSAGSGTGGWGRGQPDWAATPAPNTFRISCQTGLSSPWGLFGGRDLPSFLLQGMQKGGIPPSANAIMPSPPCPTQRGAPSPWSLLPPHWKH